MYYCVRYSTSRTMKYVWQKVNIQPIARRLQWMRREDCVIKCRRQICQILALWEANLMRRGLPRNTYIQEVNANWALNTGWKTLNGRPTIGPTDRSVVDRPGQCKSRQHVWIQIGEEEYEYSIIRQNWIRRAFQGRSQQRRYYGLLAASVERFCLGGLF